MTFPHIGEYIGTARSFIARLINAARRAIFPALHSSIVTRLMKFRSLLVAFAALTVFSSLLATNADAQVVVYRLEFEKTGASINYGFYDEGYVIADASGGPATWLLTFRDELQNNYITIEEFGSLFYANKGDLTRAVISAAAADGTPQTTFLLVGDLTQEVDSDNISVAVAGELRGYSISADDESELPFDSREGNIGYAGASEIKAFFQTDRSDAANRDRQTITEALADIITMLERRGFAEFTVEDPAATTDDGTATDDNADATADGADTNADADDATATANNGGGGGGN